MRFSISKEALLMSKVVPPGWYTCIIGEIEQAPASTDGSMNTNVTFVIDAPNTPYHGVPIPRSFNEKPKAAAFARTFVESLLNRKLKEDGEDLDLTNAKGRKIRVYVKNDTYQNRLKNVAEDFQPAI